MSEVKKNSYINELLLPTEFITIPQSLRDSSLYTKEPMVGRKSIPIMQNNLLDHNFPFSIFNFQFISNKRWDLPTFFFYKYVSKLIE